MRFHLKAGLSTLFALKTCRKVVFLAKQKRSLVFHTYFYLLFFVVFHIDVCILNTQFFMCISPLIHVVSQIFTVVFSAQNNVFFLCA